MRAFLMSGLVCLFISQSAVAIPIPIVSYTYDAAGILPSPSYTDNGYSSSNLLATPTELGDGTIASSPYLDPAWVGVIDSPDTFVPQPQITFDLGANFNVATVTITYLADNGAGVHAPDSANARFSYDGVLFSLIPVTLTPFANPASPTVLSPTFSLGEGARFVRLEFFNDQQWTFLTEVQFDGSLSVPEPSTLALLGLGTVGLAVKVRRRRAAG